ncbi:MAG TPA: hypothetical protein VEH27_17970 [Methylomirabilota bacterium]|nr:hypothetical protein [Methylomirabilota bacterium]
MKTLRKTLIVTAGLFILGLVVFLTPGPRPALRPLSIRWVGFTNEMGETKAVFTISNTNERAVYCIPFLPQEVGSNGPIAEPTRATGPLRFPLLEAQTVITVVSPILSNLWRLPVWSDYAPTFRDFAQENWRQNVEAFHAGSPLPGWKAGIGLFGQTNFSEVVAPMLVKQ